MRGVVRPLTDRRAPKSGSIWSISDGPLVGCGCCVQQDISLHAASFDQVKLTIKKINMLLFVLQNVQQQIPGHEVTLAFTVGDPLAEIAESLLFKAQVSLQNFFNSFANGDLIQPLHVW
jgi:hypothetical protein